MNESSNDLAVIDEMPTMMSLTNMNALALFADRMAQSVVTVPKHLQGKPADCLAIAMQAAQWGMNPFAVAQKTHVVNGTLGYEAQLVNAVVTSSRAIRGVFHYEYKGVGQDLECRVGATPRGEPDVIWGEWLRNGDVKIRNSPLWVTNPKQQLGYLQVKNWARLYCPSAILGIYTSDELQDAADLNPPKPGPQRRSAAALSNPIPPVDEVPKNEQRRPAADAAADPATGELTIENAAPAPAPEKKADAKPAAGAAGGVTGNQVAYLRNKLKSTGVAEQTICDRFQVTSIELLNVEQFDQVKSELLAMA